MAETKQRLEYVDFMKGMCILFIVAFHINNSIYPHRIDLMLQSFRIPLYYFLSGVFFKQYDGFIDFARRKFNNIIVPYIFFMLLTCVVHCVAWYAFGAEWMGKWTWSSFLDPFCTRYYHYNTPLWFLISLFEVNVAYYVILKMCPRRSGRYALILLLAFVALYFRKMPIFNNPAYIDTVFIAMPFFVLGNEVKAHGCLPKNKRFDRWGLLVMIPVAVMLYFCSSKINLLIQSEPKFYKLYLVPFVAVLAFFWFSKNMPRVPIVTFIGRYSIVVLGTHIILIRLMRQLLQEVLVNYLQWQSVNDWLIFACVVAAEMVVIPVMIRLFPRFTAQKELIKPLGKGKE
ncbi:MAG: acyltransferase family protein [Muribaculaceae bacterium]